MTGPAEPLALVCRDGVRLNGHLWTAPCGGTHGTVIVNPATGVLARYYHRYAAFLAEAGFHVVTYDYRGIGASRPEALRGCGYRWRDWGEEDFDAALRFVLDKSLPGPLQVVGHSIGGFLPGFSKRAPAIDRMLTVGAQYAYWRDYRAEDRRRLFLKWHVAMPALTRMLGYFPGKRLGWLEDLPAGVALEWSSRRRRMETSYPQKDQAELLACFAAVRAPILAVGVSDDALAPRPAIDRALAYYTGAKRTAVVLAPEELGFPVIGHFGLFHARHRDGFWRETLRWLRDGINPWASAGGGLIAADGGVRAEAAKPDPS